MAAGSKAKAGRKILLIILIAVFLGSGGLLFRYWYQGNKAQGKMEELRQVLDDAREVETEESEEEQRPGFDQLLERNGDFAGWITIEGTTVDYPVMSSPANSPEYYLRRNFDKEYDYYGTPFLDARCSLDPLSGNLIVYGHNIRSGIMFYDLLGYEEQSFWEDHPLIQFDTLEGPGTYEVFAAFLYDAYSDEDAFKPHAILDFTSEEQFQEYLQQVRAAAFYETGVEVSYGDQILTLVTCDKRLLSGGRLVVTTRRIPTETE